MRWLEQFFLERAISRAFSDEINHAYNVTRLYAMIRAHWELQFYEDSPYTTDANLRECFEKTQFQPSKEAQ